MQRTLLGVVVFIPIGSLVRPAPITEGPSSNRRCFPTPPLYPLHSCCCNCHTADTADIPVRNYQVLVRNRYRRVGASHFRFFLFETPWTLVWGLTRRFCASSACSRFSPPWGSSPRWETWQTGLCYRSVTRERVRGDLTTGATHHPAQQRPCVCVCVGNSGDRQVLIPPPQHGERVAGPESRRNRPVRSEGKPVTFKFCIIF